MAEDDDKPLNEKKQTNISNMPEHWTIKYLDFKEHLERAEKKVMDANMLRDCPDGKSEDYRCGFVDALIFMKNKFEKAWREEFGEFK